MRVTIEQTLARLEREHHIRILYAVESGSRAWGFASANSDYDVRYIYVRTKEDYLRLDQFRDTIEGPLDEVLDFSGWDIRKALGLLRKTNPSLMEWVRSPIVYRTTPTWERLAAQFPAFFSVRSNMYHYLSMAGGHWEEIRQMEQPKLKRYLYATRGLLCARWLETYRTAPPVLFAEVCAQVLPRELEQTMADILERKNRAEETGRTEHIPQLDRFLDTELARLSALVKAMPAEEPQSWDRLNAMFLEVLEG